MVKHKLRNLNLVWINGVKEVLDSCQIVHTILQVTGCECQEPPALQLERRENLASWQPIPVSVLTNLEPPGGVHNVDGLQVSFVPGQIED